jgi:hypothetical protein
MSQFPDTMAVECKPPTAADVAAARQHSTGRVYPLHRGGLVCCDQGPQCNQGRCPARMAAKACTDNGAEYERPAAASLRLGLLLVVLVSALSYGLLTWAGIAFWPQLLALLG